MVEHAAQSSAQHEHVESFAAPPSPRTEFDRALLRLIGLRAKHQLDGRRDGRHAAMRKALDDRATFHQIRDWRRGKARPPQWAIELVATKLESYGEAGRQLRRSA